MGQCGKGGIVWKGNNKKVDGRHVGCVKQRREKSYQGGAPKKRWRKKTKKGGLHASNRGGGEDGGNYGCRQVQDTNQLKPKETRKRGGGWPPGVWENSKESTISRNKGTKKN